MGKGFRDEIRNMPRMRKGREARSEWRGSWRRVRMRVEGQVAREIERAHSLEVIMHSALDTVGLQAEVNVTTPPVIDVVLVEYIIQALIQVLQVQ